MHKNQNLLDLLFDLSYPLFNPIFSNYKTLGFPFCYFFFSFALPLGSYFAKRL